MAVVDRFQVDFFAIIVLLLLVLIIVFLVIAAIYFHGLMNFRPPTQGESTFLFATAIILIILAFIIGVYALYRIFTYRAVVTEVVRPIVAPAVMAPSPYIVHPSAQAPVVIHPVGTSVVTMHPTDLSVNVSDVPVTQVQRTALQRELVSVGGSVAQ